MKKFTLPLIFTFLLSLGLTNAMPASQDSVSVSTDDLLVKCYEGLAYELDDYAIPHMGDYGPTNFVRGLFSLSELPTDEASCVWNDAGYPALSALSWGTDNPMVELFYRRLLFQINICNEFIDACSEEMADTTSTEPITDKISMLAEGRFIRALVYYYGMDNFGNFPLILSPGVISSENIVANSKQEIFDFIESELQSVRNQLPLHNAYGRANKSAAEALLAKMYLNAYSYIGTGKEAQCIEVCDAIINSGLYTLAPTYDQLFRADNESNNQEIIFPIVYDGRTTYGGTTFIINAAFSSDMNPNAYGVEGVWQGLKAQKSLTSKFEQTDRRAMFFSNGRTEEASDFYNFYSGYSVMKYTNLNGDSISKPTSFSTVDFPLFRYADVLLMKAEAVFRGGSSSIEALNLVNQIRQRADAPSVSMSDLNLEFFLNERAREFYWEGHRRTDLIRFGLFTSGTYTWEWKGCQEDGTNVNSHYNLYPISQSLLKDYPNLMQNPGYDRAEDINPETKPQPDDKFEKTDAIYITGDYNNYTPDMLMFRDSNNKEDKSYTYTGYFPENFEFKLAKISTNSSDTVLIYGTDLQDYNGNLTTEPSSLSLKIPSSGFWTIDVYTDKLAYSINQYDGAQVQKYNKISFIGDYVKWASDTISDMSRHAINPYLWNLTVKIEEPNSNVKFRADDNWDYNWGGKHILYGTGDFDGDNIILKMPGTYDVWFNDITKRYYIGLKSEMSNNFVAIPDSTSTGNEGSINLRLAVPVDSKIEGSFEVTLPEGFELDEQSTKLADDLFGTHILSIIPLSESPKRYKIEIKPSSERSASDMEARDIVKISYIIRNDGSVDEGNYDVLLNDLDIKLEDETVIKSDQIVVPIEVKSALGLNNNDKISGLTIEKSEIGILVKSEDAIRRIDVISMSGQITYSVLSNSNEVLIPSNNFADGVYLLKIQSDNDLNVEKIRL